MRESGTTAAGLAVGSFVPRRNREVLWAGLALALLIVMFSTTTITDYDFWWHLNLGRSTLTTGSLSLPDTFTYTIAGRPNYRGEWLGDLVIYLSYGLAGLPGVYVLKALLLLGAFLLLAGSIALSIPPERKSRLSATVITLVLALFAIRFRLFVRPFLFSFLFVSLCLYLICRYRREQSPRLLWLLPVIELVWANTSKGAIFGPLLLALLLAAGFLEGKRDLRVALVLFVTFAASLVSPETWNLYTLAAGFASQEPGMTVGEQRPLSAMMLWGYGWRYTLAYQIMVLVCAVYFVLLRGWRNFFHLLLFLAFFVQSLLLVRMIDFFSLVAAPFVAIPIAGFLDAVAARFRRTERLLPRALPWAMLLLVLPAVFWNKTYTFGIGVKDENIPEAALAFLDREGIGGRIFNSFPLGGYIAFRSPERRVFLDGRLGIFGNEFQKEYFGMIHTADAWKSGEEKWGFDCAILDYNLRSFGLHFPRHLAKNPEWALVYWDSHSAVYLKRTPAHQKIIAPYEYRVARPAFNDFSYLRTYLGSAHYDEILAEIERDISRDPSNQEPRLAKVFFIFNEKGRAADDEMIRELRTCLSLKPDLAVEHSALASLLFDRGEADEARRELRRALALNRKDEGARLLQQRLVL